MYIPHKQDETMAQLQQARAHLMIYPLNNDGNSYAFHALLEDGRDRCNVKACCTYGALWLNATDMGSGNLHQWEAQKMLDKAFQTLYPETITDEYGWFSNSVAFKINDTELDTVKAIAIYDKAMEIYDNV